MRPLRRLALPVQFAMTGPGRNCHGLQPGGISFHLLDQPLHQPLDLTRPRMLIERLPGHLLIAGRESTYVDVPRQLPGEGQVRADLTGRSGRFHRVPFSDNQEQMTGM
jgi:hypothetical protein